MTTQTGQTVMLQLGLYQFGLSTAAYQELTRKTDYRWPGQEVYNGLPRLQFTGPGSETITLPGVLYPQWRGGYGQLDKMRETAAQGLPLQLVTGDGEMLGQWVIESIEEKQSAFGAKGLAKKVEFTIALRKYRDA